MRKEPGAEKSVGRRKRARSKMWFSLPILFVLGRQRSQRQKKTQMTCLEKRSPLVGGKNGTGISGSDNSSGSGVRKHSLACRKAVIENLGLAPRPAFPFLSFLAILNKKQHYTQKGNLSWEHEETAMARGLEMSPPGPQRRLGSCHPSHLKPKKMHS